MFLGKLTFTAAVLMTAALPSASQTRTMSIDELFRLADMNSRSIRMHSLAIDAAEEAVKAAEDERLPSLKAALEVTYIGDGIMTDRDFSNAIHADMPPLGNTFALKASQVIYAGGAVSRKIEQKRLERQIASDEYSINRQDILFMLLGYYLDLYQLGNQKLVYEKNIEQTRLLVQDMQTAHSQGTALKSDITRYELQLQNLELGLTTVNDRINILSHHLATTIGLEPEIHIIPDSASLANAVENSPEYRWQDMALESPAIRMADTHIRLGENNVAALRSSLKPVISFSATGDLNGPILVEVPPMDNNVAYWYAGIGISYNLDALYRSRKKIQSARIETERLKEARLLAEEEIRNEVHAAYVNLEEAYTRLRTQSKSVQLAHENFSIVRQRYVNGLALVTDMLDASNTQLDMELQLANCQAGILYQYYLLKKITGTL